MDSRIGKMNKKMNELEDTIERLDRVRITNAMFSSLIWGLGFKIHMKTIRWIRY